MLRSGSIISTIINKKQGDKVKKWWSINANYDDYWYSIIDSIHFKIVFGILTIDCEFLMK